MDVQSWASLRCLTTTLQGTPRHQAQARQGHTTGGGIGHRCRASRIPGLCGCTGDAVHLTLIVVDEGPQNTDTAVAVLILECLQKIIWRNSWCHLVENPLLEGAVHEKVKDGVVADAVFLAFFGRVRIPQTK